MDVAESILAGYAGTREAADPYCLRVGEAAALLRGHPWHRFAVLGDSVAQGIGDPVEGYLELSWVDRIAAELRTSRPDLAYLNLGRRDATAAQVAAEQLAAALDFAPDLAIVACGGNDALRPDYRPAEVDRELTAIVRALQSCGADVVTVSMLVLPHYPAIPVPLRPRVTGRLRLLAEHTAAAAAGLDSLHVYLVEHPVCEAPDIYSADGIHGNVRTHAVAAAETIRRLGTYLGNV
ncbi:MAG TPA: SGNH/GDSL hydrolase family protein [Pilimelia sp.]|nr:SGNH/GDSL hydrolase family protein [Pilimelia sp.]